MKAENKLNELLKERNLTQQQLADRLGVTQPLIAKWCKANSDPKGSTLIRLATELNVSLKRLMTYLGEDVTGIPDDCDRSADEN
jgi:transcriptional regulator with XRE-family HTH domain